MTEEAKQARAAYLKEYRKKNAQRINAYQREYRKNNPDKARNWQANYWQKKAEQEAAAV